MSRYRWAFTPRWILLHVLVFLAVCAFVYAGLWQLSRLHGRRDANDVIRARESAQPVPIGSVLAPGATDEQIGDASFRRVTLTGTYRTEDQVLIRNRTNHSQPGYLVVTPLVLPDGTAVAVNRGWIPLLLGDAPTAEGYAPPPGTVTVTGLILAAQRQEGIGIVDPPDGRIPTLSRIDVERLQKQVAVPLYRAYVEAEAQDPPQPIDKVTGFATPTPLPTPELDDGPHLNYTGQWFIFATLTCIVYPLFLRRTARHKQAEAQRAEEEARGAGSPADDEAVPAAAVTGGALDELVP